MQVLTFTLQKARETRAGFLVITLDQLDSLRFAKSWSFSMRDLLTANGGKWGGSVKEISSSETIRS
jgi:hypothetical protein